MADQTLDLDTPLEDPEVPTDKPWYESNSMWASIASFLVGLLTILGVSPELVAFIGAEFPKVIGVIMTLIGVYNAWATLRRKTTVSVRK